MMAIRSRATSREKAELPPAGRPGIAAGPPAEPGLGPEPGGGRGSRATCIKGRARATGSRGSRSPRVLLKGHSVHSLTDLTGGQRPRGASPLAATHSASLNHIHLASLWNRLGKQSLFHVASYMSLCFMHVRGLSHREEVRQLLWRTVLLSWWTHVV